MLELSGRNFKIITTIMLKKIVEKVDNMHEYKGNFSREM